MLKTKIQIMPAATRDARGIAEVLYKTWLHTYPNKEAGITIEDIEDKFKDAFTEEILKKRTENIANLPKNELLFIAKDADRVVGVCRIVKHHDKNQLQAIYILPEYQGKGVGKLLWRVAQKSFDSTKDIIVHVAVYNAKAIHFYEKLGFKDTGKRFTEERHRMKSGAIIPEMEMILKA